MSTSPEPRTMEFYPDGKMRWFGESWNAPMCDPELHIPTPVGILCECREPIEEGDQGIAMLHVILKYSQPHNEYRPLHLECHLRRVFGGLNHQKGLCICCGGDEPPDPPGMTMREAAKAAVAHFEGKHR